MRLLFAYDHKFRWAEDGRVWTTGALAVSVWQRYLQAFDEVIVLGRDGGEADDPEGLARSDTPGVSFTFLDNINGPVQSLKRPRILRQVEALVARADAVVARLPSEFGLLACAAARRLGKPYLVEVVGSAFDAFHNHGTLIAKIYGPVAEDRLRRAVREAPLVTYVTAQWLQSQYPSPNPDISDQESSRRPQVKGAPSSQITVSGGTRAAAAAVTNAAVVLPTAKVRAERERRLAELREGRTPVLGTIGSLSTRYKGIQIALPALSKLRKEGFAFTYRILGGGDREPWQKLIDEHGLTDRCFLDGTRPAGEAVLSWLDEIDIYVQPSLQEGLPRSVLEAMSRGAACIGSSAGGLPELIDREYVHKAGHSKELADHLRRVVTDWAEVRRLSQLSFEKVVHYAPKIVEAKRQAMLSALAAQARSKVGLLFAHDHVYRRGAEGEVWTTGAVSHDVWDRYLPEFGKVTVIGRDGGAVPSAPNSARADGPHVAFCLLPSVNGIRQSLRRPKVRRSISKLVRSSEAVAARLPSEFGLIACELAHKHDKPLLVEVAGSALEALRSHGSSLGPIYAPIADLRMRRAVANSPFTIYVTRSWLQRLYPSPNPTLESAGSRAQASIVDAMIKLPDEKVRAVRSGRLRKSAAGEPLVFGTIATLGARYKGLQFAIPAFATLRKEGRSFTYRILGQGDPAPWQAMIDSYGLRDCCFLDGALPAGEPVLAWLDGIDVHVQPSLTESLGRGTIEAMSRGVACIGSSAGGLAEYLDRDWLHPPGDQRALTDHLRRLIEEPGLVIQLSEAAFRTVERFDPAKVEAERARMMHLFAKSRTHG
jgi:glycosyltransferase involved in cell wall biosynthesis